MTPLPRKFAVALVDYLKDQTESWEFIENPENGSSGYQFKLQVNTRAQRLNEEQRAHIKELAENLVPAMYSVQFEFIPR